ncbi:energy transducer TonB [Paenochrobactrum gallinarii]|uniref:energy transducer TonB n=1 Tax=Paenochrobactrum gallinarii TaxID=643673 RepID=UPI0035BC625B
MSDKVETNTVYLSSREIDKLSLSGTAAGIGLLNSCVNRVVAQLAAERREREKWEYLPKDPFASQLPPGPKPATPRSNPGSWVSARDYPTRALREKREGKTSFFLTVGAHGLVTNCQITRSSGHTDLDETTCTNIQRRARFLPAIDDKGVEIPGTWSSTVNWQVPDIQPPLPSP